MAEIVSLGALRIGDFRRRYEAAKKPKAPGGPERIDRTCKIIKMLRELFKYGVTAELPECQRLRTILMEAEFRQARRRKMKLELEHVEAFVAKALRSARYPWRSGPRCSSTRRFGRRT